MGEFRNTGTEISTISTPQCVLINCTLFSFFIMYVCMLFSGSLSRIKAYNLWMSKWISDSDDSSMQETDDSYMVGRLQRFIQWMSPEWDSGRKSVLLTCICGSRRLISWPNQFCQSPLYDSWHWYIAGWKLTGSWVVRPPLKKCQNGAGVRFRQFIQLKSSLTHIVIFNILHFPGKYQIRKFDPPRRKSSIIVYPGI